MRDFANVDDATSAFEAAAGIHAPEPAVFSMATGVETSVREVACLTVPDGVRTTVQSILGTR